MSNSPDLVSLALTLAVGIVWAVLILLTVRNVVTLRRRLPQGRSHTARRVTHLLEERRSLVRHLVTVICRADLQSALLQAEADGGRVAYSPEAQAEMTRHNIIAEHVEAVIAYPSKRRHRPKDFANELSRGIGSRTLLVLVADPALDFSPPYVKRVLWQEPSRLCRLAQTFRRSLGFRRSQSIG